MGRVVCYHVNRGQRTTAVRRDTLLTHTLNTLLLDQSAESMERSSSFESTDPLLVLALEK